jgi:hypothetical protein
MNVVVEIDGRQAIPVRAIPLLTDWKVLSPDVVARILSGDIKLWLGFKGLPSHRVNSDGSIGLVQKRWWSSWIVRKLQATSDAIKANETSRAMGSQQWRRESLAQLPAGVFVWRDEFEAAHLREYGPDSMRARSNPDTFDPDAYILDFNPNPDPEIAQPHLVLEGFGLTPGEKSGLQDTAAPAPVLAGGKKWTPEKLAELKTYREAHTMTETAENFGITEQRIRQLLPSQKTKPKPYSSLIHHMK